MLTCKILDNQKFRIPAHPLEKSSRGWRYISCRPVNMFRRYIENGFSGNLLWNSLASDHKDFLGVFFL